MGFQDLRTNQRLKEVMQAIQGSFIAVFAEMIGLRTCLDTLTFDLILVKLDQKQEFLIHEKLCTPL